MEATDDFQELHDQAFPASSAEVARACVSRVRASMLRSAVIRQLIARNIEPDEMAIDGVVEPLLDGTRLALVDGRLALVHASGHTIRDVIGLHVQFEAARTRAQDLGIPIPTRP